MDFLPYTMKWLELVLRWGHVLFAILWVGNSFLFNYLDNKLNKSISSSTIDGEGYLMHSGYFYKLTRLKKSPPVNYLKSLVIFKWQSYLTFITGILLLFVIYYYNSGILMVNKKVLEISPISAVLISILSLYFYWLVYDFLCKSSIIKNNILFILISFSLLLLTSFGLTKIFTPKFAFLSVGLILGTNMFGNVFTVIIPNQMNIIKASLKNKKIDSSLSLAAKQRSIHNNYSTFLVLFIMLSGHYSFIVYHKYNWLILCAIAIISVTARHYFNLRGRKIINNSILIISILAFIFLAFLIFFFKP
ncbi:urate hydroxylase PuuD [Candidatus Pelagibacter sp. Uisw_106]|uniref:urate hydroxylase PuuD n=1 Tax=Candidatus Pelagibacter sp. Uisw_106 TaxID=3230984 RepID=UPI0039EBBCE7